MSPRIRVIKLDKFKFEFNEDDWNRLKSFAMKNSISFQEVED